MAYTNNASSASPQLKASNSLDVKILVIGDRHTGKTSLIHRYVHKQFIESERTVGADICTKSLRIDDTFVKVMLWDIAGQERFIGLAPTYFRNAVAAVIVFDITDGSTLDNAMKWKANVDEKVFLKNGDPIPVILCANKWDLVEMDNRLQKVSDELLNNICREHHFIEWVSTSAKTGLNVRSGMNKIVKRVLHNHHSMLSGIDDADNNIAADTIDLSNHRPANKHGSGCFQCSNSAAAANYA